MAKASVWSGFITMIWVLFYVNNNGVIAWTTPDYRDALSKSLLFLEAQRSGKLPSSNRVSWRGDSGLNDGSLEGVDLVGGYYDAGDNVKFGLPMAFSMTMLSWSVIQYQKNIAAAEQLGYALEAIRWGTDYFLKAHPEPNLLWGEVGDGDSDHACWQRAEDMTTSRKAYKIDASNPGSDLAGETAAAMAAASIAFRDSDESYSNTLLQHAVQLFEFADKYRGRYDRSMAIVAKYYSSASGYNDELLWAALWLYQATGQDSYLLYVVNNAESLEGTSWNVQQFNWDNKYAGVQILAAKVLMEGKGENYASTLQKYQSKAEFFLCACLQKNNGNNVYLTQGGLIHMGDWNMQYVSLASFAILAYHDYLTGASQSLNCPSQKVDPSELLVFVESQAEYILGKNPKGMSYLVGYGTNFPTQVHHRGSSIVSYKANPTFVGCLQGYKDWYNQDQPNPNVLVGALVGGPDKNDDYSDRRDHYHQAEPTTYINAPLVGIFAKLNSQPFSNFSRWTAPSLWTAPPKSGGQDICRAVQSVQAIQASWENEGRTYFNMKVNVHNISHRNITRLLLSVKDLAGPLWGLSAVSGEEDTYTFPDGLRILGPRSSFQFAYKHPGPQANVTVLSCY